MEYNRSRIYLALGVIVLLSIFLAYSLRFYISGFFGAFIFFMLFAPVNRFFTKKLRMNRRLAAILVIVISLLVIIIPASFLVSTSFGQLKEVMSYKGAVLENINNLDSLFPQIGLKDRIQEQISKIGGLLSSILLSTLQGFSRAAISLVIMYFILYYLLVYQDSVKERSVSIIPFSRKNALALYKEFGNVTYSTVVTSGLIAVLQGGLLTLGFMFFGIPGAFIWGLIGAILSFLPVVGVSVIWIPASLLYLLQQNWFIGIGMLIWGIFVSNVDNFIRPFIQLRIGRMHPLVSIIGIFIGIPAFGLVGIVIGPLLVSYFLLTVKMFKEEYLE